MSIVSDTDMKVWLDVTDDEYDLNVEPIQNAVESFIQDSYCKRTLESTSYALETYDGKGHQILNLDNYPITALDRVAIGTRDAIKIRNTSDYTTASVSVTSTGLRLVKDGTADVSVTWASNATMSAVVTAVNALGSGWEASIMSTDYNSFKSSELIARWAANTINDNWVYLDMPEDAEDEIEVYADRGQIWKYSGFTRGVRNVFVDYTAGYTAANMPEDLQLAVKILTKYFYDKRDEETWGVESFSTGHIRTVFERESLSPSEERALPKEVRAILNRYRRVKT